MRTFLLSVALVLLYGCSTDIEMTLPQGPAGEDGRSAYELWVEAVENGIIEWNEETDLPGFFRYLKGEKGDKGDNGQDAYELWKEMVAAGLEDPHNPPNLWDKEETDKDDFFRYLTGKDGRPGENGTVITIGSNGNWFVDGVDTGVPAEGKKGDQGDPGTPGSVITIGGNGNWFIDGVDTGVPAQGAQGNPGTPGSNITIGSNGNWFIDGVDTGIPAQGTQGNPGTPGSVITVGGNGNWFIDGVDTGVPAQGAQGNPGTPGTVITIGSNGNWFIDGADTGIPAEGQDGEKGDPGNPGTPGSIITIGSNGNWFIDGADTGVPAQGDPGVPGTPGSSITIGNNGNWFINGVDTEVPATGASGLSAWQLWVQDVLDEDGLEDPHKDDGSLWPTNEVDLDDFWRYLRGRDGEDGTSPTIPIVDPGESAPDVVPVPGKINVIAQFYNQAYSEYVRTSDGSVVYQVVDGTTSLPVPNALVTDMPGPGMSGKTFPTDANGYFVVEREDLPVSGTNEERFGTTMVTYNPGGGAVTVESAEITYVPQRMQVKIEIVNGAENNVKIDGSANTIGYQGGAYMRVPFTVYRKTADYAEWETIPGYLGDITQNIHAYECDADDPSSYDILKILSSSAWDISAPHTASVRRQTLRWPAMKESHQIANYNLWDEDDHYFTMVLDSYYGETPHAPAVIKAAPVQFHPLPTAITMNTYAPGGYYGQLTWTGGSFDTSDIDQNLIFNGTYAKTDHTAETPSYTLYTPVIASYSSYSNSGMFHIVFRDPSGGSLQTNANVPSVANPVYTQPNLSVYLKSAVLLESSRLQFIGPGSGDPEGVIGVLQSNETHDQFWIEAGPNYEFENIDIIYTPAS